MWRKHKNLHIQCFLSLLLSLSILMHWHMGVPKKTDRIRKRTAMRKKGPRRPHAVPQVIPPGVPGLEKCLPWPNFSFRGGGQTQSNKPRPKTPTTRPADETSKSDEKWAPDRLTVDAVPGGLLVLEVKTKSQAWQCEVRQKSLGFLCGSWELSCDRFF